MKAKAIFLLILWASPSSLAAIEATEPVRIKAAQHSSRIVSCAIRFPLDSVKFAEDQVAKCMATVKLEAVSYIHVIATADSSGSLRHNLYLSTRRAGAIEAYLANRYPHIQVHAFGGGINPKFGKLARIFIVEHQGDGLDTGVQVASVGTPEIIERTKTEIVTKTEYRDRPKMGVRVGIHSGPGRLTLSDDIYNYVAVAMRQSLRLNYFGQMHAGLRHRLLQSNESVDVNATGLTLSRDFQLATVAGQILYVEPELEVGSIIANGRSIEWGMSSALGMRHKDFEVSLTAGKSNYLTSIGLGLIARL